VAKLNRSITQGVDGGARLINYRRDGSTFWNEVQLGHIKDGATGATAFIVGVHCQVSECMFCIVVCGQCC